MSAAAKSPVAGRARRRRAVAAALFLLAVLAAGGVIAARGWRRQAPPAPPDVDLADADPAVRSAVESAAAAVRRAPASADAWGRLGMVLAAHGLYPESVACFAEAQRLDPQEVRWPYFRGVALAFGDPDAAIPHLRRAVELAEPPATAPRLRLAELLLAQGRAREAEEQFRHVLAHEPDDPRAHLGLGRLACGRGDWGGSLAHLARAADSPLTRKAARTLLAQARLARGDDPGAGRERLRADDLPDDPEPPDPLLEELERLQVGQQALLARASKLLRQGRTAEALALLGQAARDYPESASAWLGLGRALVQRGDYPAAEQALRRAAGLDPGRVEVQFYLGVALSEQGRTPEATPFFRLATELRPDYAVAQYNLGQCLKAAGDRKGAAAAFRAAVRHKPHFARAHAELGELLAREGRRDLAVEHLRLAVDLDPADARAKKLLEDHRR
jgi:tetratricopeptide (TPR) repeat protein